MSCFLVIKKKSKLSTLELSQAITFDLHKGNYYNNHANELY